MATTICPPGLTGKLNFPVQRKKVTADDELDAVRILGFSLFFFNEHSSASMLQ